VYLREKGIDFEEKDVQKDQEARDEFTKRGLRGVPAFLIGDEVVVGLDKGKIEELLKLP
jgi:glutaredoxin 3